MKSRSALLLLSVALGFTACGVSALLPESAGFGARPSLPPPESGWIPTVNIAPAIGWPAGYSPTAAAGMRVTAYARGLDHPRWLCVLSNGDVLVAETNGPPKGDGASGIMGMITGLFMKRAGASTPSANRITLLRDTDKNGEADARFVLLEGLNSPFGMVHMDGHLYVANTDAVLRFPLAVGATRITQPGTKLVDLPAGPINHHWTKNLIASPDGQHLYVTVGSNSNVAERGMDVERERAAIWQVNAQTGAHRVFASGLRNPNGLAWEHASGALWTVVNERDELGNDLVPDYLSSVRDGAFYGWPYSYYGQHVDLRVTPQDPAKVATAVAPDYALGSHTASLGLASSVGTSLPIRFSNGMFVGQHGSWNRRPHSGYKVIFVGFEGGKAIGTPVDVLTGFLSVDGKAFGRPVGVSLDRLGALLVADDVGNIIWRVSAWP